MDTFLVGLMLLAGAVYFWVRLRPLLRLGDMSSIPPTPPKPDMWSNDSW